jgi:hypothetical protein
MQRNKRLYGAYIVYISLVTVSRVYGPIVTVKTYLTELVQTLTIP